MKLTVDSSEPLEDALRVVGAMYGVTIVVSENGQGKRESPRQRTTRSKKGPVSTKGRSRAAVADKAPPRSHKARTASPVAKPTNADVRAWARQAGLSISERGRVPGSVMAAYRDAHK